MDIQFLSGNYWPTLLKSFFLVMIVVKHRQIGWSMSFCYLSSPLCVEH